MAKMPAAAAAKAPPMPADDDEEDQDGAGADAGDEGDEGEGEDEGDESEVLLTVCREPDGTYRLIKGDEDEDEEGEGGEEEGESAEGGAGGEEEEGTKYDSVGALLKAILDLLNKDKESESGEGSPDDQFTAGFNENTPAKPAMPLPQKY